MVPVEIGKSVTKKGVKIKGKGWGLRDKNEGERKWVDEGWNVAKPITNTNELRMKQRKRVEGLDFSLEISRGMILEKWMRIERESEAKMSQRIVLTNWRIEKRWTEMLHMKKGIEMKREKWLKIFSIINKVWKEWPFRINLIRIDVRKVPTFVKWNWRGSSVDRDTINPRLRYSGSGFRW